MPALLYLLAVLLFPHVAPAQVPDLGPAAEGVADDFSAAITLNQQSTVSIQPLPDLTDRPSPVGAQFSRLLSMRLFELADHRYQVITPVDEQQHPPSSGTYVTGAVSRFDAGYRIFVRLVRLPDHIILAVGRATVRSREGESAVLHVRLRRRTRRQLGLFFSPDAAFPGQVMAAQSPLGRHAMRYRGRRFFRLPVTQED